MSSRAKRGDPDGNGIASSRPQVETRNDSDKFILYSREPLQGELGVLPQNFESRVLGWPPKYLWTQKRLSWEMMVRPPDVLFEPSHTLPILGRAKTIITIHDVGFDVYPELYSYIDIVYHRFSVWFASRFASRIIVPSEFTKRELVKHYGAAPEKIFVIPHGVLPPSRAAERVVSDEYLLFVGRLERKKNIDGILHAFALARKSSPSLKLILAGKPGHGWEDFQRIIRASGVQESVEVMGYVSESEKESLYEHALALVFPTHYEGFGMPVLEAQVRGCPVITSRGGACEEVAGGAAVLADPRNIDDIASAICTVAQDAELRKRLSEEGRENASRYTWQRAAAATLRVLESA